MLKTGVTRLAALMKSHGSSLVTVSRHGEDDLVDVSATVGSSPFLIADAYGFETHIRMRDYLITAADYVFGGVIVEPQDGDQIIEVDGDVTRTFEAMSPDSDEPSWRYSDPHRVMLRIHTKLVETT